LSLHIWGRTLPEPLLKVSNLGVRYGQAAAVHGIDLEVDEGEVVALLGANGAGKSSTLLAISGMVPYTGTVLFEGHDLRNVAPNKIVLRGLTQIPERRAIFPELKVSEHLAIAEQFRTKGPDLDEDRDLLRATFPRLVGDLHHRAAGSLSGGEQQMLVVARIVLGRPKLVLIDELSLGLAPLVVTELFKVLKEVHRRGTAILLVEQFVHLALEMCDRLYVLQKGAILLQGDADRFRGDVARLTASYLGDDAGDNGLVAKPNAPHGSR
jgi:branched-chain amino acid transport system ATP-binding protein